MERTQSGVFIALLGFAVLASAAALIWSYTLETRLENSQTALVNAQKQNDKLSESLDETNAKLRATSETWATASASPSANWKLAPGNSSNGSRRRPAAWRRNRRQPRPRRRSRWCGLERCHFGQDRCRRGENGRGGDQD